METEIDKLFCVHKLTDDDMASARQMASSFDELLSRLTEIVGDGQNSREFALAKTHLETACFYAKKAFAASR